MISNLPTTALIEIIYGCNMLCKYCYVGKEKNHTKPKEITLKRFDELLQVLERLGIKEIVLLGGEPTLHPEFSKICDSASKYSFIKRGVVTNATCLNQSIFSALQRNEFWIDISIKSTEPSLYEDLTGVPGSYSKFLEGIKLSAANNIPIGIEFDPNVFNYNGLYSTIKRLMELNVNISQVQAHRFIPSGDAKKNQTLAPKLEHYLSVFNQLKLISNDFSIPAIFEDGFPLCLVENSFWELIAACGCGYSLFSISPEGDVKHCVCSEHTIGNILNDPFEKIWNNFELVNFRSKEHQHKECRCCDLFETCRGGCRSSKCTDNLTAFDQYSDQFRAQSVDITSIPSLKLIYGQAIQKMNPPEKINCTNIK